MVTEVPDDPNPQAVKMARWLLFGIGLFCFVVAAVISFTIDARTWAYAALCAVGAISLLALAFGSPGLVVALVLFWTNE